MSSLESFVALLDRPLLCDDLFDGVPDTTFFVKDAAGRYVAVNQILAERTGFGRKDALIGRTADEVFPGDLGRRIAEQDRLILRSARSLKGELELHIYRDGGEGWCLTWKEPLFDRGRKVMGLVGLSRDLRSANARRTRPPPCRGPAVRAETIRRRLKVRRFAELAKLSPFQLDQRFRAMFGISARQYLTQLKIDRAADAPAVQRRSDQPDRPGMRLRRPDRLHPAVQEAGRPVAGGIPAIAGIRGFRSVRFGAGGRAVLLPGLRPLTIVRARYGTRPQTAAIAVLENGTKLFRDLR